MPVPSAPIPKKRLSEVPEGATLRCRFSFAIVGPEATSFANQAINSTLHSEVSEVVTMCNVTDRGTASRDSTAGAESSTRQAWTSPSEQQDDQVPKSSTSFGGGDRRSSSRTATKPANLGIYCMLDEDELQIAKVRFKAVESFRDSLNDLVMHNIDGDLKNICFVFLMDTRRDVRGDVLPILNQAFAEMNFIFKAAKKKAPKVVLRSLLLTHQSLPAGHGGHSASFAYEEGLHSMSQLDLLDGDEPAVEESAEVAPFVQRLHEVAKAYGSRKPHRKVDFDNGDAIFQTLQRVAREMFKANTSKKGYTRGSSVFDSIRGSRSPDDRRHCCAVQ